MPKQSNKKFKIELPSGKVVLANECVNLRSSLKSNFNEVYHKNMKFINCKGFGTCGTCAMHVEGGVTPPTKIEMWRLNFPPHKSSLDKGIRLLCQCSPLSDIKLKKLGGRWGQGQGHD